MWKALRCRFACGPARPDTALSVEQRIKEFGVRKTLGASSLSIVGMVAGDFAKLVLIAILIAWPLGYVMMNQWLTSFAYRIDLGISVFLTSGTIALAVALATVGYHATQSGRANPVEALRHE